MSRRRGCRGGRKRHSVSTVRPSFDTSTLKARFIRALDSDPGRAEAVHAEWVAVGRQQIAGRRGDDRSRVVAGLHAIDEAYAEFLAATAEAA